MARSFKDAIKEQRRDPLQNVDQTVPGFLPDPSTFMQPTPGGERRARTFSQTIAETTRVIDRGMGRWFPPRPDLTSQPYKPDFRGHYDLIATKPVPRSQLHLATLPIAGDIVPALKYSPDQPRDQHGRWTQTGTAEFKSWFGDSKVVDADGKPLRMYHGTGKTFPAFDRAAINSNYSYSFGFHFSDQPEDADVYAEAGQQRGGAGGNIVPAYLSVKNPLVFNLHGDQNPEGYADVHRAEIIEQVLASRKAGKPYDGIILNSSRYGRNVVVFDPTQIKSAIGNRGTFDPNDPDIAKEGYDPSQPRDENGRWTSEGVPGDVEAKRAQVKALIEERRALADKVDLTAAEAREFQHKSEQIDALRYDLAKPMDPAKLADPATAKNAMSHDAILAADRDIHRKRAIYLAIKSAAQGAGFDQNTAVDNIMLGRNPDVTPGAFYENFAGTRAALRADHGDTVTLYRAEGRQMPKPTQNWATTRAFAEQFGSDVVSREVPVDNVLAVHVSANNRYHEFIVGKPPVAKDGYDPVQPRDERGRWVREGSFTAYHGTLSTYLDDIKREGLKAHPSQRNFQGTFAGDDYYYRGARGESVYVATSETEAKGWATSVVQEHGSDNAKPVVFHVEIPKEAQTNLTPDEFFYQPGSGYAPNAFRFQGDVKPEWIKGVRIWRGGWSEELPLSAVAKRGTITLYLCVLVKDGVAKEGYDPSEPRDEDGRWTATGTAGGKLLDKPTQAHRSAIMNYQANGYRAINAYLDGSKDPRYSAYIRDARARATAIKNLDNAMEQSRLPKTMTLYRGLVDSNGTFENDAAVGKVITYPKYLSTSTKPGTARMRPTVLEQEKVKVKGKGWVMKITAPAGTHAIDVNHAMPDNAFADENEVLVARGQRVRIDAIERHGHTIHASIL